MEENRNTDNGLDEKDGGGKRAGLGRRKRLKRVAFRAGGAGAFGGLGVASLLLLVYFLGVTTPGRSYLSGLARDEIHGEAEIGGIEADPVDGSVTLVNVAVRDQHNAPVLEVEGLYAVPTTFEPPVFDRLTLDGGKLYLSLDEQGRFNLDTLFKSSGPSNKPSKPDVFSLSEVSVSDFSLALTTPFLDLDVGPVGGNGFAWQKVDGSRAGTIDATIETFSAEPKLKELASYAAALLGRTGPLVFGPLEGVVDWVGPKVTLRRFKLGLGGFDLIIRGEVDVDTMLGEVSLALRGAEVDTASIAARSAEEGWTLSGVVNRIDLPRTSLDDLEIPAVTLEGANFSAAGETASLSLSRLFVDRIEQDGIAAKGVAVSGTLRYLASAPFVALVPKLEQVEGEWDRIAYLLKEWKKGEMVLSVLVDEVGFKGKNVVEPMRVKFNARPGADGVFDANLQLALHPLGTVSVESMLKPAGESGRTAYGVTVKVEALDLGPLLVAADPPMMLKRMLSGKLEGGISFHAPDLGSPVIVVTECRFELAQAGGGMVVFSIPEGEQKWDLSVDPEVSLFKKEIAFGEGKLKYEMKQAVGTERR